MDKLTQQIEIDVKGLDSLMKAIDELMALIKQNKLFAESADDATDAVDDQAKATEESAESDKKKKDSLSDLIKTYAKFAGAVSIATGFVTALFANVSASFDPLVQASRTTGITVEAFQELGYAASVSGSSVDGMKSTLEGLTASINSASLTGGSSFARFGLSIEDANGNLKKADEMFLDIADRMEGLSFGQQQGLAKELGIDDSMLQTLRAGRKGIEDMRATAQGLGIVSTEDAAQIADVNDAVTGLKTAFSSLSTNIVAGIAPTFISFVKSIQNFIIQNKDLIKSVVGRLIEFMQVLTQAFIRLLPALAVVAAGFVAVKIAMMGVDKISKAMMKAGIFLLITGIILLIDDLMVHLEGGESKFGKFWTAIISGAEWAMEKFEKIYTWFKEKIDKLKGFFVDMVTGSLGTFIGKIMGLPEMTDEQKAEYRTMVMGESAVSSPEKTMGLQTNNSSSQTANVNNNVQINVTGSDALATASATKSMLDRELANSSNLSRMGM